MRTWKIAAGVAAGIGLALAARPAWRIMREVVKAMSGNPAAWAEDIARFAREDRASPPPPGVIVFTGSSSINYWSTLQRDMAPLPVVNRGFGGARLSDVVYWVYETVIPYKPRAAVLFAGTNDLVRPRAKTPGEVFQDYVRFVEIVQARLPETLIYYVSITPTPSRRGEWPAAQEVNRLVEAYTARDSRLRFIDMTPHILGPDGRPDRTLYRLDRLHPNQRGYARWTSVIRPMLLRDLAPAGAGLPAAGQAAA